MFSRPYPLINVRLLNCIRSWNTCTEFLLMMLARWAGLRIRGVRLRVFRSHVGVCVCGTKIYCILYGHVLSDLWRWRDGRPSIVPGNRSCSADRQRGVSRSSDAYANKTAKIGRSTLQSAAALMDIMCVVFSRRVGIFIQPGTAQVRVCGLNGKMNEPCFFFVGVLL